MIRNQIALVANAFILTLSLSGCSESDFKGGANNKKEAVDLTPVNRTINLTCDQTTGDALLDTSLTSEKPIQVQIEGEICGVVAEEIEQDLNVVFVLDFSGSMQFNDPIEGDVCGRYSAAQAIVSKMQEVADKGVNVSMGAVQFGSDSLTHIPVGTLDDFKTSVTTENFCGNSAGTTNYQAALEEAKTQLSALSGRKVLYFITDGAPTAPGSNDIAQSSGLVAAEALRSEIQELTFNAIYLQERGTAGVDPGFDPQQYLQKLVGAPDRVKLVSTAGEIASEITEFETPEPVTLDTQSASTTHIAATFGEAPVKLESFEKDPNRPGVWVFKTEPVLLYASQGEVIKNVILLKVETSAGNSHNAQVSIEFEQTSQLTK